MRLLPLLLILAFLPAAAAQGVDPYGVHVGLSEDGASLTVAWFTRQPAESTVTVKDAAGNEATFTGESTLLPQGALWSHEVALSGVAPGSNATYSIAGGASDVPLHIPRADAGARLVFIGDMGVNEDAAANIGRIAALAPDAVLHVGDISYAEGDPAVWDAWFTQVEPVARATPWLPALGNHETYIVPSGVESLVTGQLPTRGPINPEVEATKARFQLPGDELSWSWTVGGVHVVSIDTFWTSFAPGAPEALWLAEDLAANADADWTIVFLHEPPYSSNMAHGSSEDVRAVLAPIVEAAGVDLVIAGHDHHYERTWPLRGDAVVKNSTAGAGTIYMVTGGGGASLYTELAEPQPEWSAARAPEFHVTLVEANATRLTVTAVLPDGGVMDTFAIEKPSQPAPLVVPPPLETSLAPLVAAAALAVGVAFARRRR